MMRGVRTFVTHPAPKSTPKSANVRRLAAHIAVAEVGHRAAEWPVDHRCAESGISRRRRHVGWGLSWSFVDVSVGAWLHYAAPTTARRKPSHKA